MDYKEQIDYDTYSKYNKISTKKRKYFKNKYLIFTIICISLIVTLFIVSRIATKKINEKNYEITMQEDYLDFFKEKLRILDEDLEEQLKQLSDYNYTLLQSKMEISSETKISEKIKQKYSELLSKKRQLISQKEELKNKTEQIINIKTRSVSEENNKLKEKFDNLKENKKLVEYKLKNLNVKKSIIINKISVKHFETTIGRKILKKCYDNIVYGFDPKKFHNNCDGNSLLILIKTDKGIKLGAFISKKYENDSLIYDENSILLNLDSNVYYSLNKFGQGKKNIKYTKDEFPKFGDDLTINLNGEGYSKFPSFYGDIEKDGLQNFVKDNKFKIENLEIYIVKTSIF